MKYKIVRENKPTLKNFGRYKAAAMLPDHHAGDGGAGNSGQLLGQSERRGDGAGRAVGGAVAPSEGRRPCAAEAYRDAETGDREREGGCAWRLQCPEAYPRCAPPPTAREPKGPPRGL